MIKRPFIPDVITSEDIERNFKKIEEGEILDIPLATLSANSEFKKKYNKVTYKIAKREYRRKNWEQIREYQKAWRKANLEKDRECCRLYYIKNKDKINKKNRAGRKEGVIKHHSQNNSNYCKGYYQKHKAEILAKRKAQYYQKLGDPI